MRRRVRYLRTAVMTGLRWLNSLLGTAANLWLVITGLGLVAGATVALAVLDWPVWTVVLAALIVVFVVFFEGAFRENEVASRRVIEAETRALQAVPPQRRGVVTKGGRLRTSPGLRISNQDVSISTEDTDAEIDGEIS